MMTYGWAILIIVIAVVVLYSLGIFAPGNAVSSTVTGFSGLGSVQGNCIANGAFNLSIGNNLGKLINITRINVSMILSGITGYATPNELVASGAQIFVNISNLCPSLGSRFSAKVSVTYIEPSFTFKGPYFSSGTIQGITSVPGSGSSGSGGSSPPPPPPTLTLPTNVLHYQQLNITNNANIATQSPFVEQINMTVNAANKPHINNTAQHSFQNVEFFVGGNGNIIPSWLENYSFSNGWAMYWISISGLSALTTNSSIYIGYASNTTNLFSIANGVGENPVLSMSPTGSTNYGEYDTGNKVFPIYFNGSAGNANFFSIGSGASLSFRTNTSYGGRTINTVELKDTSPSNATLVFDKNGVPSGAYVAVSDIEFQLVTAGYSGFVGLTNGSNAANIYSGKGNEIESGYATPSSSRAFYAFNLSKGINTSLTSSYTYVTSGTWYYDNLYLNGTSATTFNNYLAANIKGANYSALTNAQIIGLNNLKTSGTFYYGFTEGGGVIASGTACINNSAGGSCSGNVWYTTSTTLTSSLNVSGNVTIEPGETLTTNGYYILARNNFTNMGIISTGHESNGGSIGNAGTGLAGSYGGAGGSSVYSGGSTLGTSAIPSITTSLLQQWNEWTTKGMYLNLSGGGGGGGNVGQAHIGAGGAGGGGGYGIYIQAKIIDDGQGKIITSGVNGGNGNGGSLAGGAGGGGGGGGDIILAYYKQLVNATTSNYNVSGGAGGAGGNPGGGPGNSGAGGVIKTYNYSSTLPLQYYYIINSWASAGLAVYTNWAMVYPAYPNGVIPTTKQGSLI
jgi:hypothetical protein